eukprot:5914142-Prymnesium_polylepis.2
MTPSHVASRRPRLTKLCGFAFWCGESRSRPHVPRQKAAKKRCAATTSLLEPAVCRVGARPTCRQRVSAPSTERRPGGGRRRRDSKELVSK